MDQNTKPNPVQDRLGAMGWTLQAVCTDTGGHKESSKYRVTIKRKDGPAYETSYSQGSAHRKWAKDFPHNCVLVQMLTGKTYGPVNFGGTTKPPRPGEPVSWAHSYRMDRWKMGGKFHDQFRQYTVPTAPQLADVMYCLVSDAQLCDGTFEDFCLNLGLDTDSRKALESYLQCQKTQDYLRSAAGKDWQELQELFEDY